ncbi:DUF2756 domain-containing protein, partial [Salmonella enterica]
MPNATACLTGWSCTCRKTSQKRMQTQMQTQQIQQQGM